MKGVMRVLALVGMLLTLGACGRAVEPQRVVIVATDTPIPTVPPTNTLPPPPRGIAAVEEAGSGTTCPDGYPIKADDATRMYYRPGQRSYDAMNARHCFVSEATAQTAGYRASQG